MNEMEEKQGIKISLSTFFLILSIIAIIIMGIFIYKLNKDKSTEIQKSIKFQSQVNTLNGTISELQGKINTISGESSSNINTKTEENKDAESELKTNSDELYIISEIEINSRDYEEHQAKNDNNVLYNFKTKKWVNQINGAEGMYFIAIDNDKNLYIVDRFENILKKLDAKLSKLRIDDTNIDNYITYARVSKLQNILEIQTGDDFITYIVNLADFSTKLAEINDE